MSDDTADLNGIPEPTQRLQTEYGPDVTDPSKPRYSQGKQTHFPEPRQYHSNEDFLNRGLDEIRELRATITRLQEQLTTARADAWDEGYDCGAADYTESPSISSPTGQINPYRATPEDDNV